MDGIDFAYVSAGFQCSRKRHMHNKTLAKRALRTVRALNRGRRYDLYRCPMCGDGWIIGGRGWEHEARATGETLQRAGRTPLHRCRRYLHVENFGPHKGMRDGLHPNCRGCERTRRQASVIPAAALSG
jgi:hypothetical protein